MKILYLHLKSEYYDDIESGKKPFEYRLYNDYWKKRLAGRRYDTIMLMKGYPKKDDMERRMERPYLGYSVETITHEHFGKDPVEVFSIPVNQKPIF